MTPDISEFSYGFALTNELIDLVGQPLRAAPIFPSLIEEGRPGGGYDVNLDIPGYPLFLQFKRSDCMVRRTAIEVAAPFNFAPPFYRMKLTERSRSAQHEMLVELDDGHNLVFYVAPLFHTIAELNEAYLTRTVSSRSFYIRPRDIGILDDESHHVAFNGTRHWVFSEPREVKGIGGEALLEVLRERRIADERPFRAGPLDNALARAREIARERLLPEVLVDAVPSGRDEAVQKLRLLADLSLRYFGTQLFVVQDA